ncbi:MAG: acetyl-CoA carboxylase biotin carboxyl carrier protein subunit [Bacteroidales bacterium]|nr:acetyl-CoA carboxylase biotin carboxyl carrier protein subunit [Bacteroidales bacterium]
MATENLENGPGKITYKTLNVEYHKYKTTLTQKYLQRQPWSKKDIKKITAFIPGLIVKVYVKKGDRVKAGDKLVTLEAMKMKNELLAPVDGKIKELYVKEGNKVAKQQIIVELE